jgi:integrase
LMAAAAQRRSRNGLRGLTYTTLIGLLAATGLRPGEALILDRSDVDLDEGILSIRESKFGKSRLVPIAPSTRDVLHQYANRRDALCVQPSSQAFLLSEGGRRVQGSAARDIFAKLTCEIGLRRAIGPKRWGRGPRLQDLRHTFTTRRLVEWYRAGVDVGRELPKLSTYLGHVEIGLTYWYLEAIPEPPDAGHGAARQAAPTGRGAMTASSLPSLLQRFFTERLITQQGVSPYTVAGYRDTFRLLFRFTTKQLHRAPSALRVEDLDAPFLERFLEHLERDRRNHPRTRNHRLASLHGFFRYVALAEPAVSLQCQRILAIPSKRFERRPVEFLTEEEIAALAGDERIDQGRGQRALLADLRKLGTGEQAIKDVTFREGSETTLVLG